MSALTKKRMINELVECIDIPESAYEKAERRYEDLGDWFDDPSSKCAKFKPHIYPQGSFRLGTVVRPLTDKDEYDLDVGCRLTAGITKATWTQAELKKLVAEDLEAYRKARQIANKLDEKDRCWRLQYEDKMRFHMDVVPSIPEDDRRRRLLQEEMVKVGSDKFLAEAVANKAGAITDRREPNYHWIDPNWHISNSEGYALWFESQMKIAKTLLESRALQAKVAKVDDLPTRKWKSPLQRCVQILKCHRDQMFKTSPKKPISIIITTLAGLAYDGEEDVDSALETILGRMADFVKDETPRVANPVNPSEDFADKWGTPEGRKLQLEENFWAWLKRAQTDLGALGSSDDPDYLVEQAKTNFGAALNAKDLGAKLGIGPTGGLLKSAAVPAGLSFPNKPLVPEKPAGFA
jgi:hypothetical protein